MAEHLPPGPHPPAEPWVGRRLKLRMTSHHSGSAKATRGDVTGSETEVKNFRMIWDGRELNRACGKAEPFQMESHPCGCAGLLELAGDCEDVYLEA